jgi:hypothetical protein
MDIEWIIYHLIHNDDDEFTSVSLDIDLCRADDDLWDRLLAGLERSQTLTSLELVRGLQRIVATEVDLRRLFSSIRSIPALTKVKLDSFSTDDFTDSASLFTNNEVIQELIVENVRQVENPRNHNRYDHSHVEFLTSMCQRCLRRLQIEVPTESSLPIFSEEPAHVPFAPLLDETSKLETLVIEFTSSARPILQAHFASMMQALETNDTLKNLDIDLRIYPNDLDNVSKMLERNHNLLDLRLHVHHSIRDHPEIIHRFFKALKVNNKLKKLVNYGLLGNQPNTHDLIDAEFDMLERNLNLESFAFFNEDSQTRQKREIFLRLNKKGRQLVHNDNREKVQKSVWVTQLAKHTNDLDCLFYYLSSNPFLCSPENGWSFDHEPKIEAAKRQKEYLKLQECCSDSNPRSNKRQRT